MATKNSLWKFDFTLKAEGIGYESVIKSLNIYCKKWVFQLEKAPSGYIHFQGRVSLKKKMRLQELIKMEIFGDENKPRLSATMTKTKGFEYVMKDDSRVSGPWKDSDKPRYIPRQYRGKMETLRPFQKYILDTAYDFEDRIINVIICPEGGIGKSMIASLGELYRRGIDLPVCNDADKLIQSACNICMKKNIRNPSPLFIDLPRAFNQEKMCGIFTAIEQIKKGKLYDMRYNYTEWWIDSPQIWVFTNNEEIDLSMLSRDRWRFWKVHPRSYELREYGALACNTNHTPYNTLSVGAIGAKCQALSSESGDESF